MESELRPAGQGATQRQHMCDGAGSACHRERRQKRPEQRLWRAGELTAVTSRARSSLQKQTWLLYRKGLEWRLSRNSRRSAGLGERAERVQQVSSFTLKKTKEGRTDSKGEAGIRHTSSLLTVR